MSVELVLYPRSATRATLRRHLLGHGFKPCGHLWSWPSGSLHFAWFDEDAFKSIVGVEATVFPAPPEERARYGGGDWALHTRTRAGASSFDREKQNEVIRSARREFGGTFTNDWHGTNRYTPVEPDLSAPAERGIAAAYNLVRSRIEAVSGTLPNPLVDFPPGDQFIDLARFGDPARVLYNALLPFAVAAVEHFFGRCFTILLHYDPAAQKKLLAETRRVEIAALVAVAEGERAVEDIVAGWYSFQSIDGINKAFGDWFGIGIWGLLRSRKRIGKQVRFLSEHLENLIQSRHGLVHRFEYDPDLSREEIERVLETVIVVMNVFVDHLERCRGMRIRDKLMK